jgi:hypothetical protein
MGEKNFASGRRKNFLGCENFGMPSTLPLPFSSLLFATMG